MGIPQAIESKLLEMSKAIHKMDGDDYGVEFGYDDDEKSFYAYVGITNSGIDASPEDCIEFVDTEIAKHNGEDDDDDDGYSTMSVREKMDYYGVSY